MIPNNPNNGSGEAVAGSCGGGSTCATGSPSMDPVTRNDAVLVSEPPQTLVAVIL